MLQVKYKTVINSIITLCFIMLILLIFHAIYSLGRTGVSLIVSMISGSTLSMSGSLQPNVIVAAINKWSKHACMQKNMNKI